MELIISAYTLIAIGVCIGLATDGRDLNAENHISVVIIGSVFLGALWPIYWAAKITQKLGNR